MISGKDAFVLHATYGIPVEVVESLAADHNLRIDRTAFEAEQKTHSAVSRGTTEAAAVFSTGPLDALKREYHHGNEFLGYAGVEADARVIGIIEQNRLAESARAGEGTGLALVLDQDAVLRRGRRPGRRHGHNYGHGILVRGARHQEGERVHLARRPCGGGRGQPRCAGSRGR